MNLAFLKAVLPEGLLEHFDIIDFSGEVENVYSVYTSLIDNYKFRRFTVGYGLNDSRNTWGS